MVSRVLFLFIAILMAWNEAFGQQFRLENIDYNESTKQANKQIANERSQELQTNKLAGSNSREYDEKRKKIRANPINSSLGKEEIPERTTNISKTTDDFNYLEEEKEILYSSSNIVGKTEINHKKNIHDELDNLTPETCEANNQYPKKSVYINDVNNEQSTHIDPKCGKSIHNNFAKPSKKDGNTASQYIQNPSHTASKSKSQIVTKDDTNNYIKNKEVDKNATIPGESQFRLDYFNSENQRTHICTKQVSKQITNGESQELLANKLTVSNSSENIDERKKISANTKSNLGKVIPVRTTNTTEATVKFTPSQRNIKNIRYPCSYYIKTPNKLEETSRNDQNTNKIKHATLDASDSPNYLEEEKDTPEDRTQISNEKNIRDESDDLTQEICENYENPHVNFHVNDVNNEHSANIYPNCGKSIHETFARRFDERKKPNTASQKNHHSGSKLKSQVITKGDTNNYNGNSYSLIGKSHTKAENNESADVSTDTDLTKANSNTGYICNVQDRLDTKILYHPNKKMIYNNLNKDLEVNMNSKTSETSNKENTNFKTSFSYDNGEQDLLNKKVLPDLYRDFQGSPTEQNEISHQQAEPNFQFNTVQDVETQPFYDNLPFSSDYFSNPYDYLSRSNERTINQIDDVPCLSYNKYYEKPKVFWNDNRIHGHVPIPKRYCLKYLTNVWPESKCHQVRDDAKERLWRKWYNTEYSIYPKGAWNQIKNDHICM